MCSIIPKEVVCSAGIAEKVEIVGSGGMQGGSDRGGGDVANRCVGEAAVAIGVVATVVFPNPTGGHSDVGVASVVECAVHLKAHFLLQAVVDY